MPGPSSDARPSGSRRKGRHSAERPMSIDLHELDRKLELYIQSKDAARKLRRELEDKQKPSAEYHHVPRVAAAHFVKTTTPSALAALDVHPNTRPMAPSDQLDMDRDKPRRVRKASLDMAAMQRGSQLKRTQSLRDARNTARRQSLHTLGLGEFANLLGLAQPLDEKEEHALHHGDEHALEDDSDSDHQRREVCPDDRPNWTEPPEVTEKRPRLMDRVAPVLRRVHIMKRGSDAAEDPRALRSEGAGRHGRTASESGAPVGSTRSKLLGHLRNRLSISKDLNRDGLRSTAVNASKDAQPDQPMLRTVNVASGQISEAPRQREPATAIRETVPSLEVQNGIIQEVDEDMATEDALSEAPATELEEQTGAAHQQANVQESDRKTLDEKPLDDLVAPDTPHEQPDDESSQHTEHFTDAPEDPIPQTPTVEAPEPSTSPPPASALDEESPYLEVDATTPRPSTPLIAISPDDTPRKEAPASAKPANDPSPEAASPNHPSPSPPSQSTAVKAAAARNLSPPCSIALSTRAVSLPPPDSRPRTSTSDATTAYPLAALEPSWTSVSDQSASPRRRQLDERIKQWIMEASTSQAASEATKTTMDAAADDCGAGAGARREKTASHSGKTREQRSKRHMERSGSLRTGRIRERERWERGGQEILETRLMFPKNYQQVERAGRVG